MRNLQRNKNVSQLARGFPLMANARVWRMADLRQARSPSRPLLPWRGSGKSITSSRRSWGPLPAVRTACGGARTAAFLKGFNLRSSTSQSMRSTRRGARPSNRQKSTVVYPAAACWPHCGSPIAAFGDRVVRVHVHGQRVIVRVVVPQNISASRSSAMGSWQQQMASG